ncbi:MAG: hypothetical protein ACREH5_09105 [Candidatus Omnitrophota bacterium]
MPADRKLRKENGISANGAGLPVQQEEVLHQAKERLSILPDIRLDRIRKACLRVSQGYYDRAPVIAKIADRFLEEMGID